MLDFLRPVLTVRSRLALPVRDTFARCPLQWAEAGDVGGQPEHLEPLPRYIRLQALPVPFKSTVRPGTYSGGACAPSCADGGRCNAARVRL